MDTIFAHTERYGEGDSRLKGDSWESCTPNGDKLHTYPYVVQGIIVQQIYRVSRQNLEWSSLSTVLNIWKMFNSESKRTPNSSMESLKAGHVAFTGTRLCHCEL